MRPIARWPLTVFTLELRKLFSYRVDFWMHFLGSVAAQFGVAYFLWQAVFAYRGVEKIGPFSFKALMLYYLLAPLIGRTIQGITYTGSVSAEIYAGTLTRYLVYPVSFFRYQFAAHLSHCAIYATQALLVVVLFVVAVGVPAEFTVSTTSVFQAAVTVCLALYLAFILATVLELIAFWADNVWSLVILTRFATGLFGGGMIPLALFPTWARELLGYFPFAYFISFPVRTLLGMETTQTWIRGIAILGLWCALLTLLTAMVWQRGKYKYTGVGI